MATLTYSTPSWIDSIISGKIKSAIQDRINDVNSQIAEANRKSNEEIAERRRQTDEAIAQAKRESDEAIAQANRESAERIASMNAAANVSSSVIRIIPPLFMSVGNSNNTNNTKPIDPKDSPLNLNPSPNQAKSTAKKRADDLFPNLEPTFKFSTNVVESEDKVEGSKVRQSSVADLPFAKPSLSIPKSSDAGKLAYWLAIPAIGLAMGAGSKVAFKQFSDNYYFGDVR